MSGAPDPKSRSLARGERRYRRKVGSPAQWARIIEAKRGPSRVRPQYGLNVACGACHRERGLIACDACSAIETAERKAGGNASPELHDLPVQYHHLISRAQGGDDVADNIVPLSRDAHALVTSREPRALAALAASLTDSEYAYVVGKLGESGPARLFGVGR